MKLSKEEILKTAERCRTFDCNCIDCPLEDLGEEPEECMTALVDALYDIIIADSNSDGDAEWIWDEENNCYFCSKCDVSSLNDNRGYAVASTRCPQCGAHMTVKKKGEC